MPPRADHLTRRSLLAALAASAALPAVASAPEVSLRPLPRPVRGVSGTPVIPVRPLDELLRRANLGGATGFIALDAETGSVIEEHGADLVLPPASVSKAPTTLYALHALGLEHRFVTRVLSPRGVAIEGGVLRGDLVLQGGGDPVLQTADLARLADALIERGLRRVEGRFLFDDRALPHLREIDANQPVQAGYNPAVAGLNLNFNRVHFLWEPASGQMRLSMDARSDREVTPVSVISIAARDRAAPIYTHEEPDSGAREFWTVAASALGNGGSRWLPVRHPGRYCADVLRALLAARGCTLPTPQPATGPGISATGSLVLAEHRSAALPDVARDMLRYSVNLSAECLGLAASRRREAQTASLERSGRLMGEWLGERYGAPGMQFVDHSGLGDRSRVSARSMATFLRAAHAEGILPPLLRQHMMRDNQGREISDHPVTVAAKTGTLNFVSALAGYASPPGGRTIVFAIFCADMPRRAAIPVAQRERPPGASGWTGRARVLQQSLIERWSAIHG